jgi:3-oxoacyl-[acyl-carrier-protein] synthase-3
MTIRYVRIAGWGKSLPVRVVGNAELASWVDTSDEWIRARTGIAERRIADAEETTSTLAVAAARRALERAAVAAHDLDLVLVATSTPDYASMPATASLVQHALGARWAGAFDLNAACSGFVYALTIGSQFILNGTARCVLVVGSDVFSRILDWQDRSTCVLFGDAAAAVVLQPTDTPGGLLAFELGSDGAGADNLQVPAGGSHRPTSAETVAQRQHYVRMQGREVFRFATRIVPESVRRVLAQASLRPDEVNLLIPHQANVRIIDTVARKLGLSADKTYVNVERFGNTSAASVPLALCDALDEGRIASGDTLVLAGFGAGLSWAAAVWRWQ